jgi:hypothetical protein
MSTNQNSPQSISQSLVHPSDAFFSTVSVFVGLWSIFVSVVLFSLNRVGAGYAIDMMTWTYLFPLGVAGIVACLGPMFVYLGDRQTKRFFAIAFGTAVLLNLLLAFAQ